MNVLTSCWRRQHFSGLYVIWWPVHGCTLRGLYSSFPRLASGQAHGLLCTLKDRHTPALDTSLLSFSLITPPSLQPARVQNSWGEESRMVGADLVCFMCRNWFQAFSDSNLVSFSELVTNHFCHQPQCPVLGRNESQQCWKLLLSGAKNSPHASSKVQEIAPEAPVVPPPGHSLNSFQPLLPFPKCREYFLTMHNPGPCVCKAHLWFKSTSVLRKIATKPFWVHGNSEWKNLLGYFLLFIFGKIENESLDPPKRSKI